MGELYSPLYYKIFSLYNHQIDELTLHSNEKENEMAEFFKLRGIYNTNGLYQFGKGDVQIKTDITNTFKMRNATDTGDANLTARQLTSTVATGTPPFVVTSTTKVDNLCCGAAEKFYDQNTGTWKKFWFGSQSAYNLLTPAADTVYFITGA